MADRVIVRGDSYQLRRPFFRITLVNAAGGAFDLAGCTVRSTFKPQTTDPANDPNDTGAPVRHTLVVASNGTATTTTGLYLVGAATAGTIDQRLTAAETLAFPLSVPLYGDVELTDANGEVFTWTFTDAVTAIDGYTNRTGG